jgi:septal ring factor EnvC (AmiA/AmiB activator)
LSCKFLASDCLGQRNVREIYEKKYCNCGTVLIEVHRFFMLVSLELGPASEEAWRRAEAQSLREWQIEKKRREMHLRRFVAGIERQLHDPQQIRKHPDRLLWRASKRVEALKRELVPSRKDKRRIRRNLRKSERQLEILTERGEKSAPSQGMRRQRLTVVVAAA